MVKICNTLCSTSQSSLLLLEEFGINYPLYDFQKWSVEAIVTGNHLLVCCPTGSGKTFCGEFALLYSHKHHKKTIYTTPIKALSNEKYHAFTKKYPHICFGLITGDIKLNPTADVLIMTTEILLTKLLQFDENVNKTLNALEELNISDIGSVVFDEIHMINDEHRGHVWEQTIMTMPPHIQMIGLSATLDNPLKFAQWMENAVSKDFKDFKEVYYVQKTNRAVPLKHYSFVCTTTGAFKTIKDKVLQQKIKDNTNKLILLQDSNNRFMDNNYQSILFVRQLFTKHNLVVKRSHVLNQLATYLFNYNREIDDEKEKDIDLGQGLLPALCYVFSRKQVEACANELTANILEFDSKIPYTVSRECEQILRDKLVNFEEYLFLPEYVSLVQLLQKGIGIHHAGMMPVLREMVELLFNRGFVKLLFCTETMSVGINLPVKTTIFTDVEKFTGNEKRYLLSHEYTQAAGRAGRLGLDKEGHVIHLHNLFSNMIPMNVCKQIMNGRPQTLISKFEISPIFILNQIPKIKEKENAMSEIVSFLQESLLYVDICEQRNQYSKKIQILQNELETTPENNNYLIKKITTPTSILEEYQELIKQLPTLVNKHRRETEKRILELTNIYPFIQTDKINYYLWKDKVLQIQDLEQKKNEMDAYFMSQIQHLFQLLSTQGFLDGLTLTYKGLIATQLREIDGLLFAEMFEEVKILHPKQLIYLFGCFVNISVSDTFKTTFENVDWDLLDIKNMIDKAIQISKNEWVTLKEDIQFDLLPYLPAWCEAINVEECKWVLQRLKMEKNIFVGEFVKGLLKIHNIGREFEQIAEQCGDVDFLHRLKLMDTMLLKYIVTNQSLYI